MYQKYKQPKHNSALFLCEVIELKTPIQNIKNDYEWKERMLLFFFLFLGTMIRMIFKICFQSGNWNKIALCLDTIVFAIFCEK